MSSNSASAPRVSRRIAAAARALAPFQRFFTRSGWSQRQSHPGHCDFAFGNPHELPLPGLVAALRGHAEPQDKDWFAYKTSEPAARRAIAEGLSERRGVAYHPDDVHLTTGGFANLAVALMALVDPGDEVIFVSPPWFFYEAMIAAQGGVPVRVRVDPDSFDLDLAAIEAAITPRTRAIIVNSPNNPTGLIYSPDTLRELAALLTAGSELAQRPIALLSDEAYSRIVYDGRTFHSPAEAYPYSLVMYTYGKTLLAPGQRIGYLALSERMPDREPLREVLFTAQLMVGYAFPNALMQHAIGDLERMSIDIDRLARRRDRLVAGLRDMGYRLRSPDGAFYLVVESPIADDWAFTDALDARGVYCLPGQVIEMPGYFRISLTASDDMVERALPVFADVFDSAG